MALQTAKMDACLPAVLADFAYRFFAGMTSALSLESHHMIERIS